MSPLDCKLILDALANLFDDFDARWERRFSDTQAAHETSQVVPAPTQAAAIGAAVVADNWGGLFGGDDDSIAADTDAPVVADNWGGLFEGGDVSIAGDQIRNDTGANGNDLTSSVPDALLHGNQGRATGPIIIDRPTIVDPAALQELASPPPDDFTRAFGSSASESLGPASKCVSIALTAACAFLAAPPPSSASVTPAPSSAPAPTLPPPTLPKVILGSILRVAQIEGDDVSLALAAPPRVSRLAVFPRHFVLDAATGSALSFPDSVGCLTKLARFCAAGNATGDDLRIELGALVFPASSSADPAESRLAVMSSMAPPTVATASPAPIPPRDVPSKVLVAASSKPATISIHAQMVFDEMTNHTQPPTASEPAPVFTSQCAALPSAAVLHACTAVRGASLSAVGRPGLAIIHDTKALQAAVLLTCGGDFPTLCDCTLIDVPVVLGRSCDVVVVQPGLFSSSDWVEQQPWPPPHVRVEFGCGNADVRPPGELRSKSCDAELRPTPWPSFNMVEKCSVRCCCGRIWKPPWPIQVRQTTKAYGKIIGDYALQEGVDVQTGIRLILTLCLSVGFDLFPILLVTDGSCRIDRRMEIHGHPLDIHALFYSALHYCREMLGVTDGSKNLICAINSRLSALSFHIREYDWVDMKKINSIYRYKTEEYSHDAVNKFNIYTEQSPSWLADWIPVKCGYLIGNLQPAHMDFRFFSIGNLWAIVSSLATQRQVEDILNLIKALLNSNLTSVLVLDTHLATICLLRAGLHWSMTCCIVFQPVPPPEILLVTVNNELVVTGLVASKLPVLDWMLMADIQLEIMSNGAKFRPTPWPSFGCRTMLQLLGASPAQASNSAGLDGRFGTAIVGFLPINSASVGWQVIVRGRCWSLPTIAEIHDCQQLSHLVVSDHAHMCYGMRELAICSFDVAEQLSWRQERIIWPSCPEEVMLSLCIQHQKSAQWAPRSNVLAEIHAINLHGEVSSTSMMWLSSYSKLLLDQALFVTQESQYRLVTEIATWELRPESRQLKCGASTDHITFLSGRCRGYDLHNKSSFSLWDPGGSHLLDRLGGKPNFKKEGMSGTV